MSEYTAATPRDAEASAAEFSPLKILAIAAYLAIFLGGIVVVGRAIEDITCTVAEHGNGTPAGHVCALFLLGGVISSVGGSALVDLLGLGRRDTR